MLLGEDLVRGIGHKELAGMVFSLHPLSLRPAAHAARVVGAVMAALTLQPTAPTLARNAHDPGLTGNYTVVSVTGNNFPPSTFLVQLDATNPAITVSVGINTVIVRRFNGASNLSELSAGDRVAITGETPTTSTINATRVQNYSVQVGYTQVNGTVLYVASNLSGIALRVTANEGRDAAFGVGTIIMINTTPSTSIRFLDGHTGHLTDLRPGMRLTLYGVSDREGQIVVSPHSIEQIRSARAHVLTRVAPDDSAAK
jgi:hypothetical protein